MMHATRQITIAAAVFGLVLVGCSMAPPEPKATTAAASAEASTDTAAAPAEPEGTEADHSDEITAGEVVAGVVLLPAYVALCIISVLMC